MCSYFLLGCKFSLRYVTGLFELSHVFETFTGWSLILVTIHEHALNLKCNVWFRGLC